MYFNSIKEQMTNKRIYKEVYSHNGIPLTLKMNELQGARQKKNKTQRNTPKMISFT